MEKISEIFRGETQRIDIYLKRKLPSFSRQFIKKLIEGGFVRVNSNKVEPSYRLKDGDKINIDISNEMKTAISISDMVIYEDPDILVINKPEQLLVHPTDENWLNDYSLLSIYQPTLVYLLYSQTDIAKNGVERLGLVHRLDANTSGVMVIAKNKDAQEKLMMMFAERKVEKNYKAVVSGVIEDNRLVISAPIGRLVGNKKLDVMEWGRDAITEICIIKRGRLNTYIDVFPKTGRTNQIRVHLSYIRHPIIGDSIYGGCQYKRLMLHSYSISFIHPKTFKKVKFIAELDMEFKRSIDELLE